MPMGVYIMVFLGIVFLLIVRVELDNIQGRLEKLEKRE